MPTDLLEDVNRALSALPNEQDIRRRISENLRERRLLRRMLKLAEQRREAEDLSTRRATRCRP